MTPTQLPIENYDIQLKEKALRFEEIMSSFVVPEIDIFRSPISHYRMRAEFRIWHDNHDIYHITFDQSSHQRIRVDSFPAASQLINRLMPPLIAAIRVNDILRRKLFQIDYLSTLSDQIVVSLLYHRKLDDEWKKEAIALRNRFCAEGVNLHVIGRAKKTKICLDHDFVDERLWVSGHELVYRQPENSFTQPNAVMNIKMLEWALGVTQHVQGDLLELYCGNGNFSLALARNFRQVLATEVAKSSVAAAQYNINVNQAENVKIIRMSAEEFAQALNGTRQFRRLQGIDFTDYQFETVLVDPPRSGLNTETINMIQTYPNILYISCNSETLRKNLQTLTKTHKIIELALFDQFPYTHHIECGVLLTRR